MYSIYRIVCFQNGKVYIGQTCNPKRRKHQHFSALKSKAHWNSKMQNAYNKYGGDSFYFEVIETKLVEDAVNDREIWWITHFNSFRDGFNLTPGGYESGDTGIPCVWNGVQYSSISKAAIANNLSEKGMAFRLKQGYTCDEDLLSRLECEWNGIHYSSIKEAAETLGVKLSRMYARIKKGLTKDSDLKQKSCLWEGKKYRSIREAARTTGIPYPTLRNYINSGFDSSDQLPDLNYDKRIECEWDGVVYPSVKAAAAAYGISPEAMSQRLLNGQTKSDQVKQCAKPCVWNDIEYKSIRDAARANNIRPDTLRLRILRGYTSDEQMKIQRKQIAPYPNKIGY